MKRIVLNGTAAVSANASIGVTNVATIKYPGNKPILIDQILFQSQGPSLGVIQVNLKVGKLPITSGFVPIAMFGKLINTWGQAYVASPTAYDIWTWRLPKPILVPAGEILDPTFYNNGAIGISQQLNVQITYFARVIEEHEVPSQLWAPWVASWESVLRVGGDDYVDQTTETDLYNNTESPLFVERLMGVIPMNSQSGATRIVDSQLLDPEIGQSLVKVQIVDGEGIPCVRDPVPFSHLFDQETYAWPATAILPPGGYYLAFIDENLASVSDTSSIAPIMSLVGHRQITRRDYGL